MKLLVLIRHAKSSWDDPQVDDHDRPLNERGLRNAPEMGKRIRDCGVSLDALISSTAMRARTTAEIIAGSIDWPIKWISFDSNLYHASATELQNYVGSLSNDFSGVALFGHNPGMTSLTANLWGLPIDNIPTCGMVRLEFLENSWDEVSSAIPVRAQIDFPKNLSGEPISII